MRKIIFLLASVAAFVIFSQKNVMAEAQKLTVDITTYEGEKVLLKEDEPLWSAVPIKLSPDMSKGECLYSISTDDGISYGTYIKMDSESVTLYPDDDTSPNGKWKIKFKTVSDDGIEYESGVMTVNFDTTPAKIEFENEEESGGWLSKDSKLLFNVTDEMSGIGRIMAKRNDELIYEEHFANGVITNDHKISLAASDTNETKNDVQIMCIDLAGNTSCVSFCYRFDDTSPKISVEGVDDKAHLSSAASLYINATDDSDEVYADYVIEREFGDEMITTEVSNASPDTKIDLDEDGRYSVKITARDGAGNMSEEITRRFLIDTSAPAVDISGLSGSADIRSAAQVTIDVCDEMWEDSTVDISLERMTPEKSEYFPVTTYDLAAYRDMRTVNINQDGEYNLEITATDGAGNTSKETRRFRIDANAPTVAIGGVSDGEITSKPPTLKFSAAELFYDSAIMTATLEKLGTTGYEQVDTKDKVMRSLQDDLDITIEDEGEYRLTYTASDRSGNTSSGQLKFVIDRTPPVIAGVSDINNRFFSAFSLPKKLIEMVTDKFGVTAHAYVNDEEYSDGDRIIEEGKYVLSIMAEDEAGNVAEEDATFIVDHTSPQIVLKGFDRNGNIKKGSYIEVGLAEECDSLRKVKYAGRNIAIGKDNTAGIAVDDYGDYDIEVVAEDPAGNVTDTVIHTSCYMQSGMFLPNIKEEKIRASEIVKSDKNDPDLVRLAIGMISVLSGTYGLTYRASLRD